jgi:serine/threonine protein kinase
MGVRKYEKGGVFYAIKTFENARPLFALHPLHRHSHLLLSYTRHGSKRSAEPSLSLRPSHSEREEILREADIMFGLSHPNVVRIVEVIDDSRSDTNLEAREGDDTMHIVMQFVPRGSLQVPCFLFFL